VPVRLSFGKVMTISPLTCPRIAGPRAGEPTHPEKSWVRDNTHRLGRQYHTQITRSVAAEAGAG
jgi:hypothetical protein